MHDAIKPDLTMFLHYETLEEDGKKVVAVLFKEEQKDRIILQRKAYDRKGFMFVRGILLFRQQIRQFVR